MSRTRVKICGITSRDDALAAVDAGADALGFVFYEASPRAVDTATVAAILSALPAMVTPVGLFVDAAEDTVAAVCQALPLQLLQFHGSESAEFCAGFGRPWMKAVRVAPGTDVAAAVARYSGASAVLLDSYVAGTPGGTGTCFDWSCVPPIRQPALVLAGGLSSANVGQAIAATRPFAVDVSGGVEDSPGRKSAARMREFVAAVRAADLSINETTA